MSLIFFVRTLPYKRVEISCKMGHLHLLRPTMELASSHFLIAVARVLRGATAIPRRGPSWSGYACAVRWAGASTASTTAKSSSKASSARRKSAQRRGALIIIVCPSE